MIRTEQGSGTLGAEYGKIGIKLPAFSLKHIDNESKRD